MSDYWGRLRPSGLNAAHCRSFPKPVRSSTVGLHLSKRQGKLRAACLAAVQSRRCTPGVRRVGRGANSNPEGPKGHHFIGPSAHRCARGPLREAPTRKLPDTGPESSPPTKYSVRSCVSQDRQMTPLLLQGTPEREGRGGAVQLNAPVDG